MRILYFDCFSGCAGDMVVGALRDLGVDETVFHEAIAALNLPEEIHFHFQRGQRQGIAGWKFDVHAHEAAAEPHQHKHSHEHGHSHEHSHPHEHEHEHVHGRNHGEIRALLSASRLAPEVKRRALAVFERIAIAEGRIHGVPPEDVGFHEVGAIDSIADIVAACAGIHALGIEEVRASGLVEGTGFVRCAHGQFPLPAPATLAILEGIPLRQDEDPGERITPTGAALLAEFASAFGPLPELSVQAIGYGLGTRDTHPRPNVLRAILGKTSETPTASADEIAIIETNLDDLPPEWMASAASQALGQGALDAFFVPSTMKKGRPGVVFTILARPADAETLARLVLRETSSFGVRIHTARRIKLERHLQEVSTPHGPVVVKVGKLNGEILHQSPEFTSCQEIAGQAGVSAWTVYRAACAALKPDVL